MTSLKNPSDTHDIAYKAVSDIKWTFGWF